MEFLKYAMIAYAGIGLVVGFLYSQMYVSVMNGREISGSLSQQEFVLLEKLKHGGMVLKMTTCFAVFSLTALLWPIFAKFRMISSKV